MSTAKIYASICAITEELSKIGIAKDRKNQSQGYAFRGIDDVYAALSPLLAKHKVCILPRVTSREVVERANKSGGVLFYTSVTMEFDFVSAEDGSKHTVTMVGEAMDTGDKSSNKAQSAAYKYAAFQAFCIPTEGDNDADAATHEVARNQMGDAELERHKKAIAKAINLTVLKEAFEVAVDAARSFNDKEASEIFIEAKDARKTILENQKAPA
jgi:hypothetical protein